MLVEFELQRPARLIRWHDQALSVDSNKELRECAAFQLRPSRREGHRDSPFADGDPTWSGEQVRQRLLGLGFAR